MNRLTKEQLENFRNTYNKYEWIESDAIKKLFDELIEYKALEEELGISLPILFKALKNGVQGYKSIESLYYDEVKEKWYIECIYKYRDYGTHYTEKLTLKDYGKSWYIKEDLKSE